MNLYMELTIFVYNLNLWNNHEILLFGGLLMVRVPLVILQIEIMIKQDALSKNHGNFDQLRVNLNFKLHSYNQLARYFVIIVFMVGNNTLTIDILKRGSRRSIGLHIIEDGKLEVRAPYLMPKFFIDRFVASKRDWIIKTKQTMRNRKHVAKVAYHEGSVFRLAGVPYTLHITEGNTIVILGSRIFFPKKFLHHAKRHMELWIRSFTKKYLTTRLHFFAKTMNVSYKKYPSVIHPVDGAHAAAQELLVFPIDLFSPSHPSSIMSSFMNWHTRCTIIMQKYFGIWFHYIIQTKSCPCMASPLRANLKILIYQTGKSIRDYQRLYKTNPHPKVELHYKTPFELLVATILSAQCTDKLVNTVTPGLFSNTPPFNRLQMQLLETSTP